MRIKFKKGEQRKFLKKVLENTNCPSLRELINRGFNLNYSSLKNYFSESRFLPSDLFYDLCRFSKIDEESFKFEILDENWGQVKGGKSKK